jgi:hypothetical protein
LWIRKRPSLAAWFAIGMLPAIAAWLAWTRAHAAPGHDEVTLLYTSYIGYQWLNVDWSNIKLVLWNNVSALLEAVGSLIFPQMIGGILAKMILQPLAVLMILGVVNLFRERRAQLYALFSAISAAMLLVWHYQPNQRFILPIAPLLLAGFWLEAVKLARAVRQAFAHKDRSQRVVAYGFATVLSLLLLLAAGLQVYLGQFVEPDLFSEDRKTEHQFEGMYTWIGQNTPPNAGILWENDTALALATGRHGMNFVIPPRYYYADPAISEAPLYPKIPGFMREHGLSYIGLAKIGRHRSQELLNFAEGNRELEQIYEGTAGVIYKLK